MTDHEASFLARWIRPLLYLGQNGISIAGAVLTTSSALTLIWFWINEMLATKPLHPYAGMIFFLILPGIFVVGLVLIPIGILLKRHALMKAGHLPSIYPAVDLTQPAYRRAAIVVGALTIVNICILGTSSYLGVEYMDSSAFCGRTCHSVMAPEYAAYQASAHSRVACVRCHIGPGAPWFVKAKISGLRQVVAVSLKTYSRPIPSPVRDLRPARDTCEQCHWPQKFHGDRFVVRTRFSDDEKNTRLTTILVLKVGGRAGTGGVGIHGRHIDRTERIQYLATDEKRQVIPVVSYVDDEGKTVEYRSQDVKVTPEQLQEIERRRMDCIDCHNRPSHTFQLPERAVDEAMAAGFINPKLPFARKKAVAALRAEYPDQATAGTKIEQGLSTFWKDTYPEVYKEHRAQVDSAISEVRKIYARNVFPGMNVVWGTYPNNLGHEDFPGCFRCHDDMHKSTDGKVITQDCDACHTILAMDEESPKVLAGFGLQTETP